VNPDLSSAEISRQGIWVEQISESDDDGDVKCDGDFFLGERECVPHVRFRPDISVLG
jgi:hypothetical protein